MTRFVTVPQWQGSPSTRAMALIDGAEAITGDLPRATVTRVDVPLEAGEAMDTDVRRASAISRIQDAVREALTKIDDTVVLVGGDCSISVPGIEAVAGDDLAVVWFDLHADLHTPETSPSNAFSGMALRAVLGEGAPLLINNARSINPSRVVLAGSRAHEPAEDDAIERLGVTHVPADALAQAPSVLDAVRATGATRVYVHVDLDVLDPSEITGVSDTAPFGPTRAQLVDAIRALRAEFPLAGATVAGFAPASPAASVDDLGTILRIIGALA